MSNTAKTSVLEMLRASLTKRGWAARRWGQLSVHCHDKAVTPFVAISGVRTKPPATLFVEGVIGILDFEFEEHWAATHSSELPGRFAISIHLSNILGLMPALYIASEKDLLPFQVDRLAEELTKLLVQMPSSQSEVVNAFAYGRLLDIPIENFSGYTQRSKFDAFKDFLASKYPAIAHMSNAAG